MSCADGTLLPNGGRRSTTSRVPIRTRYVRLEWPLGNCSMEISPFLQKHFGHNGLISIEQFPSGHSNLTYLVRMGTREVVLRRPPFGSKVPSAHDMAREHRVLSKLHTVYPVAPKALVYCDDLAILNSPFHLMEPIRGMIVRRDPPPDVPFPP